MGHEAVDADMMEGGMLDESGSLSPDFHPSFFVCVLFSLSPIQKRRMSKAPHVIVVGGGLAGLSATIEALRAGATVTLMDKCKR